MRLLKYLLITGLAITIGASSVLAQGKLLHNIDCVIEPHMTVELSSPVQGVLDKVLVKRGDTVKKGQVVARLKSGVEQAGVRLAKARAESLTEIHVNKEKYELSKRNLKRVEELFQKKLVPPNEFDEAKTAVIVGELEVLLSVEAHKIAKLELERAEEILKMRSVVSPIDGVVVERYKSPGEFVEDQPVLKLAQVDPLNVEVILPLQKLGSVKKGMTAKVIPENPVGGSYKAKVVIVDSVIDSASATFGIRLELPNRRHRIPAGLTCDVKFPKK